MVAKKVEPIKPVEGVADMWFKQGPKGPDGKPGPPVPSRRHGRGVRFRAHWTAPNGKTVTAAFDRWQDARDHAAKMRVDLKHGVYRDPKAGRRPFGPYAEKWRDGQMLAPKSVKKAESVMRLHVLPRFKDCSMDSILSSDIQAWVTELSQGYSPSLVTSAYVLVAGVFKRAVADGILLRSPCVEITLPGKDDDDRVPLVPLEILDLIHEELPKRYRALLLLGAAAGLRSAEARGMEVDRVHFSQHSLTVELQLERTAEGGVGLGRVKTKKSNREVPIAPYLTEALMAHMKEFPAREIVVAERKNKVGSRSVTRKSRFLFTNSHGRVIADSTFTEMWRKARRRALDRLVAEAADKAAAEKMAKRFAGVRFHDLRHFYASALISQGADVLEVQARLGHKNATETLGTYGHLWPDAEDRSRNAIEEVFRPKPSQQDSPEPVKLRLVR